MCTPPPRRHGWERPVSLEFGRMHRHRTIAHQFGDAASAFQQIAIIMADEITEIMRQYSNGNDPVKGLMADLWRHRNNIPFMTTVFEAIQEVKQPP